MPLDKTSQQLLEALKNSLRATITEGTTLADMLKDVGQESHEGEQSSQFRWEGIDDAFKLKVAGSPHEDAITSAFFQTHSYKYLDNPTFKLSFERELRQRAVPTNEITSALGYVDKLVKELDNNPGEQDSGWHPNLDEIADMTRNADSRDAKYTEPFSGGGLYPEGDEQDKGSLEGF